MESKETKKGLRARLEQEGRWTAFVKRREQLKREGVPVDEAWSRAAQEFAPIAAGEAPPAASPASEAAAPEAVSPALETAAPPAEPTPPEQGPATPPAPTARLRRKRKGHSPWDTVSWVAENLHVDNVQEKEAPSLAAWNLLQWAKGSPDRQDYFWRSIWTKTLPAGGEQKAKEADADSKRRKNGMDPKTLSLIELIDKVGAMSEYSLDPEAPNPAAHPSPIGMPGDAA